MTCSAILASPASPWRFAPCLVQGAQLIRCCSCPRERSPRANSRQRKAQQLRLRTRDSRISVKLDQRGRSPAGYSCTKPWRARLPRWWLGARSWRGTFALNRPGGASLEQGAPVREVRRDERDYQMITAAFRRCCCHLRLRASPPAALTASAGLAAGSLRPWAERAAGAMQLGWREGETFCVPSAE